MIRPEATEYPEYCANYISKVPGPDVLSVLESQRLQMLQLFAGRSERDGSFRYAPGKWTVKEVLGHITDTERIFTYRALRSASISLFRSFKEDVWPRRGMANEKEVTVRALAFITAGHQIHHRIILEERYFPAIPRA